VPVLYTYLDNLPRWFKRRFGGAAPVAAQAERAVV
jgi:hypothetical protein